MTKKKWIICGECEHYAKCSCGQAKMHNISANSKIYYDVGCYNHEQYHLLIQDKQLKLF